MGHGFTVYQETLRVPLLFLHPRWRESPIRIPGAVSGVDLLPTLLERREEIYDLANDPREARPLADRPGWASELEAELVRLPFGAADPAAAPSADTPEDLQIRRQLEALGYVDASATDPEPDPIPGP